jgi:hypothetical protein
MEKIRKILRKAIVIIFAIDMILLYFHEQRYFPFPTC